MSETEQIDCPYCGQTVAGAPDELAQHPGQTIHCTHCGKPFVAGAAPPMARLAPPVQNYQAPIMNRPPKIAVIAIVALALGILGFVVPLLATAGAVVCGIIGVRKTGPGKARGRGLAIAALCLAGVQILLAPVMFIALQRARASARRVVCMSNLRQIDVGCFMYANENKGELPDTVDQLFPYVGTGSVFVCPDSSDTPSTATTQQKFAADLAAGGHNSYVYVGKGMKLTDVQNAASTVLFYERLTNHHNAGSSVAFADGHIEWISSPSAQKMIRDLQAGHNPPLSNATSTGANGQ